MRRLFRSGSGQARSSGPPAEVHPAPALIHSRTFGPSRGVAAEPMLVPEGPHTPAHILEAGQLCGGVVLRAASTRGVSHGLPGSLGPRQDTFFYTFSEQTIVVTVADGVGDAELSHLGAAAAAAVSARAALESSMDAECLGELIASRLKECAVDYRCLVSALATTLLVARITLGVPGQPWPVEIVQWGDSPLLLLDKTKDLEGHPCWIKPLAAKDEGMANTVRAFPQPGPARTHTHQWQPAQVLVACTDGVDLHLRHDNPVGHGLAGAWWTPPSPAQFLADTAFDRAGALDDRTAVALWRTDQASAAPPGHDAESDSDPAAPPRPARQADHGPLA